MTPKCPHCVAPEDMVRFEGKDWTVEHGGLTATVHGLAGWRCGACGEVEFDPESALRYAAAGDDLVLQRRAQDSRDIRRIRRKLGLTQAAAAHLTGGGHNAFSRYERGEVTPLPAVTHLFQLLDRHPDLLKDLTET